MGGGDTFKDDFSRSSSSSHCFSCNDGVSEEFTHNFSNHATDLRRREKTYQEILQNHDLLLKTSKRKLKLARDKILSYTPGSWTDINLSDYYIPKTTAILIIGPKGAGKSSLVNRITKVIEDDKFAPARAQESYGKHSKGGTFFVQEYMIPRGSSASFCLYDTRGLSEISSSDNTSKIEQWITRGVQDGEPVIWTSDSSDLRDRLIRDGSTGCEIRKVNSVIFVVDAVEILKSMDSEASYADMISTAYNCPLLSFKDDKPAVVMTHGDILLLEERARVRVFLGELLGIPPDKQIFDIPESRDIATKLTICNLLRHSLEHADKNLEFLPKNKDTIPKEGRGVTKRKNLLNFMLLNYLALFVALAVIYIVHISAAGKTIAHEAQQRSPQLCNSTLKTQSKPQLVDNVRVPNPKYMPEDEPRIDWRRKRGMWLDEQKVIVTEAEPSVDWRMRRRFRYVE